MYENILKVVTKKEPDARNYVTVEVIVDMNDYFVHTDILLLHFFSKTHFYEV